jgi:hypothetical protein
LAFHPITQTTPTPNSRPNPKYIPIEARLIKNG